MLKRRLIPCILLRNGVIVQSKGFRRYQLLGTPTVAVERLSDWASDELVYLDISREAAYDLRRDDLKSPNRGSILEIIADVARHAFMPLTFGGGIRTLDDVVARVHAGADKVAVNTQPLRDPAFVEEASREVGSQCVVVSIDARARPDGGGWEVFADGGREPTGRDPAEWAAEVEQRGAGEIFLNSIDRDGRGGGYDLELIDHVAERVTIPVIACGGAGSWDHMVEAMRSTAAAAISAANIFHYTENSVRNAKNALVAAGLDVRGFEAIDALED
jgi:imidazole glycerol-phosphate synthase subunit HisF